MLGEGIGLDRLGDGAVAPAQLAKHGVRMSLSAVVLLVLPSHELTGYSEVLAHVGAGLVLPAAAAGSGGTEQGELAARGRGVAGRGRAEGGLARGAVVTRRVVQRAEGLGEEAELREHDGLLAAFAAAGRENSGGLDGSILAIGAQDGSHACAQLGVARPQLRILLAGGVGKATLHAGSARARGTVGGVANEKPLNAAGAMMGFRGEELELLIGGVALDAESAHVEARIVFLLPLRGLSGRVTGAWRGNGGVAKGELTARSSMGSPPGRRPPPRPPPPPPKEPVATLILEAHGSKN